MLRFMLDRLRSAPVDQLIVATRDTAADEAVAQVAADAGVAVVRGAEHDVLDRYRQVLDRHPADRVVRLTADCPLADPELLGAALARHRQSGAAYTSNTIVRTFPDGLDVEVIEAEVLLAAAAEAIDPAEREHVTPFFYRRPERFALAAFVNEVDLSDERWTVDTPDDLTFIRTVVAQLGRRDFAWHEVLRVAAPNHPPAGSLRLVTDATSTPDIRRWRLTDGVTDAGSVVVTVRAGQGTAELVVEPELASLADELLRRRLTADAQVTELHVRR
jgi:spore coat polysaccharide biosynthesis protein SpsF